MSKGNFNKKEIIDMTNLKFDKLTVIKRCGSNKNGSAMWECSCECGGKIVVSGTQLRNGKCRSCGCLHNEILKNNENHKIHGLRNTRLFNVWSNMKSRCYNENNPQFKDYGGRGIKICDEWLNDFKAFYDWSMENEYNDELTIDRIDNDGNYEPSNCKWATQKEQSNNQRSNRIISHNGVTKNLIKWSEELNIPYDTLRSRLDRGWSIEKALTTCVKGR